ncbi:DHA2 family efflux MFS transporter permease subunit [Acidisoma cellulosilytica]|uniref:DHA2 family efflux MFS transporter permease subunit n=2 Tax=Acidisoma cellulosilyticum TaxID=2802395 RepID=A0A963YXI2_9PROT|nr:DHA2 family efflux MFS transporter permease subunit [Acidisoma cellulosilyticum]
MRMAALIVASALFMQNLDSTVVATALPTMAKAFDVSPVTMNIAITSYLVSLAAFIPASGWVADRYGARAVFRAAIIVFTLASVLCGVSQSLAMLVAARILQGLGGAMMVPVGRLLLLRRVGKTNLVAAMSWLTMPALLGPVIGPPVGGFLVTTLSWHWIFDINIPIGIVGVLLVTRFIREDERTDPGQFDFVGQILAGIGMAGLIMGLSSFGRGALPPSAAVVLTVVGALGALGYVLHARHHAHPLLDLTLMRVPTFAVSVYAGSLFRIGIGAMPFLLPLMLQLGFGFSAFQSGLITFISAAGALVTKPVARPMLQRFGFRSVLSVNAGISAVVLGLTATFRPGWPIIAIYAVLLIGGVFRSLQFTAYNTIAYADISPERMSRATSFYSTLQQLSITLGVTVGAAALAVSGAIAGKPHPRLADFSVAFVVVALFMVPAALLALRLPASAGDEMSGHATARR